jgi:hypothetical protein
MMILQGIANRFLHAFPALPDHRIAATSMTSRRLFATLPHRSPRNAMYARTPLHAREPALRGPIIANMMIAATLLTGCSNEVAIQAVVAETEAFCAAHPVPPLPARVTADRVYVGAGALTQSWLYWIPQRLLQKGFNEVESKASIAPYVQGSGDYLRFRIADANDPGCAGQRALAAAIPPHDWQAMQRRMADQGLRPDQCLAIERATERRSRYLIEVWDANASLSDTGLGVPVERHRRHYLLTDATTGRVMHEHYSEHGFVNHSIPVPFGCLRLAEWKAFTDDVVIGTGAEAAIAKGPEIIEAPPAIDLLRSAPVIESVVDLAHATIDGLELSKRRERSSRFVVQGFDILEGDSSNPHETNPGWPRYLQLVVDGGYRRVRLAWLEGKPHGMHDRPLRMFDLGDRIGVLSVTRRLAPGTRGAIDLSWAELSRDTGLPVLRADAVVAIDPDSNVAFQTLVEQVQRGSDGLSFSVTEVGTTRGARSDFILLRETKYRWSLVE